MRINLYENTYKNRWSVQILLAIIGSEQLNKLVMKITILWLNSVIFILLALQLVYYCVARDLRTFSYAAISQSVLFSAVYASLQLCCCYSLISLSAFSALFLATLFLYQLMFVCQALLADSVHALLQGI